MTHLTTRRENANKRIGRVLVQEQQVLPIENDGKIVRFARAGYRWINPFTETALPAIDLGYRAYHFTVDAQSAEGHETTITGKVGYFFDPEKANIQTQSALARDVATSDTPLKAILADIIGPRIRNFVQQHSILQLTTKELRCQLEKHLRIALRRNIKPLGMQLAELKENGKYVGVQPLIIEQISLPIWLKNYLEMANYISNLAKHLELPTEMVFHSVLELKRIEIAAAKGNLLLDVKAQDFNELQRLFMHDTPSQASGATHRRYIKQNNSFNGYHP